MNCFKFFSYLSIYLALWHRQMIPKMFSNGKKCWIMKIHLTHSISSAFKNPFFLFIDFIAFYVQFKLILLFFMPFPSPSISYIVLPLQSSYFYFSLPFITLYFNGWMNNKRNTNLIFNGSERESLNWNELSLIWIQCVHKILQIKYKIYWNGKKGIRCLNDILHLMTWPFKTWYIIQT